MISRGASGHSFDLADPDLYATGDPEHAYAELRREAPLHWQEEPDGPGFWAVLGHAAALAVYRDSRSFSSARGIVLAPDRRRADPAGGRMLALTDPPRHRKVRDLIGRAFTARAVARLEATVRERSELLVGDAVERGGCEFVEDVAARLPVAVTCDLMGAPRADWDRLYRLTRQAFGSDDPEFRAAPSARRSAAVAHHEIMVYWQALVAQRRQAPGEDVVSALATGRVDGEPLSDEEILLDCDNLLVAGNETVRHAAAGAVLAFARAPGQWERLHRRPELIDSAVEEVLRWTTPALHVLRTAVAEVVLGGARVRAGEQVVVWNLSANRDEAVFAEPRRFDIERRPNPHLTLGTGEHYCLGSALARLQLRELLSQLSRRVRRFEPDGPMRRLRSNLIGGYTAVPVRFEPR